MLFRDIETDKLIEEKDLKEKLRKRYNPELVKALGEAFTQTEVNLSYCEDIWRKGEMFLYCLELKGIPIPTEEK